MFQVDVPIEDFFAAMSAAKDRLFPFAGAVLPLIRGTDANWTNSDIATMWQSLHDVTGTALIVLCPGADYCSRKTIHAPRSADEVSGLSGLGRESDGFDPGKNWGSIGWNNAIRTLAHHLGISENGLPSVVFFDFASERYISMPLPDSASLYDILKTFATCTQTSFDAHAAAFEAFVSISQESRQIERSHHAAMNEHTGLVRQFRGAADRIRRLTIGDMNLHCSAAELLENAVDDASLLPALQDVLRRLLGELHSIHNLQASLAKKLRKIIASLGADATNLAIPGNATYEERLSEVAVQNTREAKADAREAVSQACRKLDVIQGTQKTSDLLIGSTSVSDLVPATDSGLAYPGLQLHENNPVVATPISRVGGRRKRLRNGVRLGVSSSALSALLAIIINVATGGGGRWTWVATAVLIAATAVIAAIDRRIA
jgi:hypothetical protein